MSTGFKVTLVILGIITAIGYLILNSNPSNSISKEEEAKAMSQVHFHGGK